MNALVYESVLRVLAPLEAWQDAETFVKVRGRRAYCCVLRWRFVADVHTAVFCDGELVWCVAAPFFFVRCGC